MARVRSLTQSQGDSRVHPTEVDCTWQVVRSAGGDVLLQLSTYGSDGRQSQPKVSQTIQLDRAAGAQLLRILEDTFGL